MRVRHGGRTDIYWYGGVMGNEFTAIALLRAGRGLGDCAGVEHCESAESGLGG